jgi:hypothetical protein
MLEADIFAVSCLGLELPVIVFVTLVIARIIQILFITTMMKIVVELNCCLIFKMNGGENNASRYLGA